MNMCQINGPHIFMILLNMKHLQWSWRAAVGSTSGIFRPTQVFQTPFPSLFDGLWKLMEAMEADGVHPKYVEDEHWVPWFFETWAS